MEISPTRLKEARQAKGLSIRALAREAGVATETIWSTENGRRTFLWPATARKLAAALDVSPQDLTQRGDPHA